MVHFWSQGTLLYLEYTWIAGNCKFLLVIHMCIMWLTPNMWKVVDFIKWQSAVKKTSRIWGREWCAVLCLSCSWVSEQSKSLRCWHASCLQLSLLSCCLLFLCWGVNCLPYLWTRSLACRRLLSSHHERYVPERYINSVYFNRKTYKHNLRLRSP